MYGPRAQDTRRAQPDLFAWLTVVAIAWIAAYWLEATGAAHVLHHHTIYHSGQIVAGGIALLAAWQVMTAAMMLPGTLPAVLRLAGPTEQLAFIAVYAIAWTGFALVAFVGDMGLHALVHGWALAARFENLIPAAVLGTAALYQVSPWKGASLAACRQPVKVNAGALKAGISYSRHCIVSGWALMLIMFSAGVADLTWMIGLALTMLAEKTLLSGDGVRYAVAVALALLAIGTMVG